MTCFNICFLSFCHYYCLLYLVSECCSERRCYTYQRGLFRIHKQYESFEKCQVIHFFFLCTVCTVDVLWFDCCLFAPAICVLFIYLFVVINKEFIAQKVPF